MRCSDRACSRRSARRAGSSAARGATTVTLKLEARFAPAVIDELKRRGHAVEVIGALDETVGHAGGIARHANGALEAGFDPRSDGGAAGF